jgi:hypothetical protein
MISSSFDGSRGACSIAKTQWEPNLFAEGWHAFGLSPRGGETEPEQKTVSLEACKSLSPAKYKCRIKVLQVA